MINVFRNPNFPEWYNVMFQGKLVDNAKTFAKAMQIASNLRQRVKAPIISSK